MLNPNHVLRTARFQATGMPVYFKNLFIDFISVIFYKHLHAQ
jgi:hypothetical protein